MPASGENDIVSKNPASTVVRRDQITTSHVPDLHMAPTRAAGEQRAVPRHCRRDVRLGVHRRDALVDAAIEVPPLPAAKILGAGLEQPGQLIGARRFQGMLGERDGLKVPHAAEVPRGALGAGEEHAQRDRGGGGEQEERRDDRHRRPVAPDRLSQHVPLSITLGLDRLSGEVAAQVAGKIAHRLIPAVARLLQRLEHDGLQVAVMLGRQPARRLLADDPWDLQQRRSTSGRRAAGPSASRRAPGRGP